MNNIFLNSNDPLLNNGINDARQQELARIQQEYLQKMSAAQQSMHVPNSAKQTQTPIWDEITSELDVLTSMQRKSLEDNEDFSDINCSLQMLINEEIMNMIRPRIEATKKGQELLDKQLTLVKKLKKSIVEQSDKELEEFREWKKQNQK